MSAMQIFFMVDKLELSDFEFNLGITAEMFRVLKCSEYSPLADIRRVHVFHDYIVYIEHPYFMCGSWGGGLGSTNLENFNFLNLHGKIPLPSDNSNVSRNFFFDPCMYSL